MTHQFTNRLINASSPYLLQHAHNPVDWWEWCDEAFDKALKEDKLVLVSIGYSACHWCHVMEHGCFEKEDTAAIMNEHFVCIKVDREERPDVDQIYMDAVQLLTGRGGWPLNCFVLPDGRPIHGGTYFPKEEWERTLNSLKDFYTHKKEDALRYAAELTAGIKKLDVLETRGTTSAFSFDQLASLMNTWSQNMDQEWGGYNYAPKFPMPNNWELFMQFVATLPDITGINAEILHGVHHTLIRMAEGGIYDQVGGGFCRYSTDSFWKVPHFEKMLYDNAQLMGLYSNAFRQNKNPLYRAVVNQTNEFIQRELCSPEGLFYSALDADSEGVEGKFYIWTKKELAELLEEQEPLYSLAMSVDAFGNWEHGANILYKTRSLDELKSLTGKTETYIKEVIVSCNKILLDARSKRVRPGLDDKIITCWNALMIKGYAEAYEAFGDLAYLEAATKCADSLLDNLWKGSQLFRIYKNGKVTIPGFAEDYAALSEALIHLYEAGGNEKFLEAALKITESAIKQFYSNEAKLFYFKSSDDKPLITRKIDTGDDVIPSANSMFAKVLIKLGFYFDKEVYHGMVDEMIARVEQKFEKYPGGYSNWLQVVLWKLKGFKQVVVCGDEANKVKRELENHYLPGTIVLTHSKNSRIPLLIDKPVSKETQIFVCVDKTCGLPVDSAEKALEQMAARL